MERPASQWVKCCMYLADKADMCTIILQTSFVVLLNMSISKDGEKNYMSKTMKKDLITQSGL